MAFSTSLHPFCPGDLRARATVSSDTVSSSPKCADVAAVLKEKGGGGGGWGGCISEFICMVEPAGVRLPSELRALVVMVKQDVGKAVTSSVC